MPTYPSPLPGAHRGCFDAPAPRPPSDSRRCDVIAVAGERLEAREHEGNNGCEPRLRSIAPTDLEALRRFVHHLSHETAYKRLLSGRVPSETELQRWAAIDRDREAAIVAITSTESTEMIVGVARYLKESNESAEFAIVIADDWQGRGLGKLLMASLLSAARQHGLHSIVGTTLASNAPMLSLARGLGFTAQRLPGAFATFLTLQLPHCPAHQSGQAAAKGAGVTLDFSAGVSRW